MAMRTREKKKRIAIGVLVFLIVVSVISIILSMFESSPKPDLKPLKELARMLAEETATLVQNKGRIVLIGMEGESYKLQAQEFENVFKEKGSMTIAAAESMDPKEIGVSAPGTAPAKPFLNILGKHPQADAVVSLVGPPDFKDDDIAKLPPNRPRIIVFASMGGGVKRLLEQNAIQMAIVPRMAPPSPPGGPRPGETKPSPPAEVKKADSAKDSARAGFEARYQIFTPKSDLTKLFEPPMPPRPPAAPASPPK